MLRLFVLPDKCDLEVSFFESILLTHAKRDLSEATHIRELAEGLSQCVLVHFRHLVGLGDGSEGQQDCLVATREDLGPLLRDNNGPCR